jgi:2-iminobutanoate/2-iminopropanoate deaminase
MEPTIVSTDKAPPAVGPYSQAVVAGDLVFTAGQLPIDPQTGAVAGQDIASQTRQAMENVAAVLAAAGSALDKVVKTTVFLTDIANFAGMNSVYAEFFPSDAPARSTIPIGAMPKGLLIEIEAIAVR